MMLATIAVILITLWLLGMAGAYVVGAQLHLLLAFAILAMLVSSIGERRIPRP